MDLQLVHAVENMEKRAVYQPITEDISDEEAPNFDLGFDIEKYSELQEKLTSSCDQAVSS